MTISHLAIFMLGLQAVPAIPVGGPVGGPEVSAEVPPLQFVNARPAGEDRTRTLSQWALSCRSGIRVISDEGRDFDRVERLKAKLAEEAGALAGHRFTLKSYQLLLNSHIELDARAWGVALGSVGYFGTSGPGRQKPRCARAKMPLGWFDPAELTNEYSPLIVQIEAELDGRPLTVHTAYSPSVSIGQPGFWGLGAKAENLVDEPSLPEVRAAMDRANAKLVEGVHAMLPPVVDGQHALGGVAAE